MRTGQRWLPSFTFAQLRIPVVGVCPTTWQLTCEVVASVFCDVWLPGGSLVVPTLAPILVWLWLDRQFVAKVVVPAWKPSAPASPSAADPS